jgi:hypothetical protein
MSKPPVNIAVPTLVQQQQAQQQQQQLQQKKNPQKNQHPNQNQQSQESGEWTDEKLVDALKRLDDLHSKVRIQSRPLSRVLRKKIGTKKFRTLRS